MRHSSPLAWVNSPVSFHSLTLLCLALRQAWTGYLSDTPISIASFHQLPRCPEVLPSGRFPTVLALPPTATPWSFRFYLLWQLAFRGPSLSTICRFSFKRPRLELRLNPASR